MNLLRVAIILLPFGCAAAGVYAARHIDETTALYISVFGACVVFVYVLVVFFITENRFDYIPILGTLWWLSGAQRERQAHLRDLCAEIRDIERGLRSAARQTKISEVVPKTRSREGDSYVKTIEFSEIIVGEGVAYARVKTPLPSGSSFADLSSDAFRSNAVSCCHREVQLYEATKDDNWSQPYRRGYYFIKVALDGSASGIPDIVSFADAYQALRSAKESHEYGPLAWVIGMSENALPVIQDFRSVPHILGAGASGGGKTMDAIQMILTWCLENPPRDVHLILVDMKRNTYQLLFRDLPHLARPVATTREDAMAAIAWMRAERQRRSALLEEQRIRTVYEWNARHYEPMPIICAVIDEIHMLMLRNPDREEFENDIWDVTSLGRELGMFVCLYTQHPIADVISTSVKTNIENRLCHLTDGNGSNVVIGTQDAKLLGDHPGRLIYMCAAKRQVLQAPLVANTHGWATLTDGSRQQRISDTVGAYVDDIREKWETTVVDSRARRLLEYVLAHPEIRQADNDYKLVTHTVRRELASEFGSQNSVERFLRAIDGCTLEVGDYRIDVLPPSSTTPRRARVSCLNPHTVSAVPPPPPANTTESVCTQTHPPEYPPEQRGVCAYCKHARFGDKCPDDPDERTNNICWEWEGEV